MSRTRSVPTYRRHKQSGQAIVTLTDGLGGRHDVLLGKHGTAASRKEYARMLAEWEAGGRRPPAKLGKAAEDLTINELILAYWQYVEAYYVKDGQPTSEQDTTRQAARFLKAKYGHTRARDFGPLALKAVRADMVSHPVAVRYKVRDPETGKKRWVERIVREGLARRYINKQISRLRRMFAWAVEEELVPVEVHAALLRVKGLRRGQGGREKPRIRPVPGPMIDATLPHLPAPVAAMVQVQRLCGCRPQDVVQLRALDIDRSGPVWEYRPARYKTEHAADACPDRERVVYLGPRAQTILLPFLSLNVEDYLFSPGRSEDERNKDRRENRKSPMTPSQRKRRPKGREYRPHYSVTTYRHAVRRGCLKAGVPIWVPLQLRHSRGTEIRKRFGLEASQAVLGHSELGVTQVYAEVDAETAHRVMAEIG